VARDKGALMRSMNEGIASFGSALQPADPLAPDRWSFVCECGSSECTEWVELELGEYAAIRARPDGAVCAEGHGPAAAQPGLETAAAPA
jgi:hypothetical protein